MIGIVEVAKHAGVSTASVSRVLAGKSVRDDVRTRVTASVEALGYRPNRVARNLRSAKSSTIGLIVADIQNAYFTQVARAVEDAASKAGYAVLLCNSDENAEKESTYLHLLRDENVAGVILAPTQQALRGLDSAAMKAMPVVVIDRPAGKATTDTVVLDNIAAGRDLTTHLLSHNRKRIAGLFGEKSATGKDRHAGFVLAHEIAGVRLVEELVQFVPPREQDGFEAAAKLLARKDPPDAILTSNGLLAAGAFRAITAEPNRCPKRVAFASFDDTIWSPLVSPAVTVIAQPTYEIGRTATELLLSRLADAERSTRHVILPHRLIVRRSCGCRD